jgi:transaldolase
MPSGNGIVPPKPYQAKTMTSKRDQLAEWTTVVADSGDLSVIETLRPVDATTNPSLLLAAAGDPAGAGYLDDARHLAREVGADMDAGLMYDCFAALVGQQVTRLIPGQVSTEVDARLSFDTRAMVERGRRLASLYRELDVDREQFLIKVAGTWEGIRAADVLETEGIRCNVTLLFNLAQARAAAEAGATLVSPFVGRIHDWFVKHRDLRIDHPDEDPGVKSVREIFAYLKGRGFDTIVMGASFRNAGQVEALAGCDRLTISPKLLEELAGDAGELVRRLDAAEAELLPDEPLLSEAAFRLQLNEDPMASDLLADGIRRFSRDQEKLESMLQEEVDA